MLRSVYSTKVICNVVNSTRRNTYPQGNLIRRTGELYYTVYIKARANRETTRGEFSTIGKRDAARADSCNVNKGRKRDTY
jgi:hypothetical protein